MISNCMHPKEKQSLVVVEAFAGYEATRVHCKVCNEFISPINTTVVYF